jgi:hypothetical protein
MSTERKYEVHYEDGEVYTTDYAESYEIFKAQHNGGRRCYVQPVVRPYVEP